MAETGKRTTCLRTWSAKKKRCIFDPENMATHEPQSDSETDIPVENQTRQVQPWGSSSLPHWIPVRVSYSFCARGPVWKLLMVYALPS